MTSCVGCGTVFIYVVSFIRGHNAQWYGYKSKFRTLSTFNISILQFICDSHDNELTTTLLNALVLEPMILFNRPYHFLAQEGLKVEQLWKKIIFGNFFLKLCLQIIIMK